MKNYVSVFSELFLKILALCLGLIPVFFLINLYTDWGIKLKIGHGQEIDLPDNWQDLLAVEGVLGILLLICLVVYKIANKKSEPRANTNLIKNWALKTTPQCHWEITSYSVNNLTLMADLNTADALFGKPEKITYNKLLYPKIGLDILYAEANQKIAGFMFHFIPDNTYKACPLKAKLNDGTWQNLSQNDTQQTIRSLLGQPAETCELSDGFTETFYWERSKIQIFYTLTARLNMLLFANR